MDNSRSGGSNPRPVDAAGVFVPSVEQPMSGNAVPSVEQPMSGNAVPSVEQPESGNITPSAEQFMGGGAVSAVESAAKPTVTAEQFASEIRPFGESLNGDQSGEGYTESSKNLGSSAIVSEGIEPDMIGSAEPVVREVTPAPPAPNALGEDADSQEQTQMKSLASDGSTEKKSKKFLTLFDGDTISKSFKTKIDKQIETHKNDPHGLDNVRNEEMTEYLRDEYGRIFADDGNEAVVIPMAGNMDENRGGSKAA